MSIYRILFNPLSGNRRGAASAHRLDTLLSEDERNYENITEISDMAAYLDAVPSEEKIVVAGGDGTLCRFINDLNGRVPEREILYYAAGTGNDFTNDLGRAVTDAPFRVNEYLADLPVVYVNGMEKRFFNGIGYGIDGYCCEIGDHVRATSDKPVNYTAIAIKGLLYGYHRTRATVSIDGETHSYENVWLAPTMKGRYIGGGMLIAPQQDRMDPTGKVSLMVMRCKSKIKTLSVFPSIFKGTHINHKKIVDIYKGHDIHVTFDRPTALQIDGETVLAVTEYRVTTGRGAKKEEKQEIEATV